MGIQILILSVGCKCSGLLEKPWDLVGLSYFVFILVFYFHYFLNTGCFFFLLPVEPLFKMVLWWQLLISRLVHVFLLKLVNSGLLSLHYIKSKTAFFCLGRTSKHHSLK